MNPCRSLRRHLGSILESAATALAIQLLRIEATLFPLPAAAPITPCGNVLFVGAHPDDESAFAGATLAAHAQLGDKVTIIVVANGSGSRAAAKTPQEAATLRAEELQRAVEHLGATHLITLGHDDLKIDPQQLAQQLQPHVAAADLIYTHGPVDFHPDHLLIAGTVAKLVRSDQYLRLISGQCLLTPLLANRIHTVAGPAAAAKCAALAAHASQAYTLAAIARQHALLATAHRSGPTEQFWELDGAAFQRIMTQATWLNNKTTPFRSVRPRAFTDPLAVLRGTGVRLALRRAAR